MHVVSVHPLKCGLSNIVNGSEDHVIQEEIPKQTQIKDDDNNNWDIDPLEGIHELDCFSDEGN